jgi:hypothetical protein
MATETPDLTTWTMAELTSQRDHLTDILLSAVGWDEPWKPKMRAEVRAIREEITRRAEESQ